VFVATGFVVKARLESPPAEITIGFEQAVLTPSEAPILTTFVFRILIKLKEATPLLESTGFAEADIAPTTGMVHAESEYPVNVIEAAESVLIFEFPSKMVIIGWVISAEAVVPVAEG
jgi:hypothetical protein